MSLHDENVAGITLDNIESEPVVSESHMSALDLDESDDVSLVRLLKKGLFSKAGSNDADLFIYNQFLRHIGMFGVKIHVPLS